MNKAYSSELNLKYGVPKGSCSWANNFTVYCASIGDLIPSDVDLCGYADDHSLHKSFKATSRLQEAETILTLENTVESISSMMDEMKLKLNADKMEVIIFSNQKQIDKCTTTSLVLDGNLIEISSYVKYLGGGLDKNLNYKHHVGNICSKAMCIFFKIHNICQYLNRSASETLLLGLCVSHLDYSNLMLSGLPEVTVDRLQRVQNICAKLVLRRKKSNSMRLCVNFTGYL